MDESRLAEVDGYLRARMEEHKIPAVAASIVLDGVPLRSAAYGVANLEWDAPATPDTSFQLASATKLLTATLLMMLVETGTLSLDASLAEYLPDIPPAWTPITLRHLASHTSGIPDDVGSPASLEEAVAAATKLPLAYEPGAEVRYGLLDFAVLAHVLQHVTARDLPSLLADRLLIPLGMTSTRFDNAAQLSDVPVRISDVLPRRASVYNWDEDRQKVFSFLFPRWTYAAGGLYSSAADLTRWAVALDRGSILSPESMRAMWTRHRLTAGGEGAFGVGWIVDVHDGRQVTGHSGGPALADIVRFPEEKLTVAVLANQQNLRPYLAMGVADLLLRGS